MEYIVGITLALFFCAAAAGLGMDRERVFYPAVVIAVASYYLAFAVVDGRSEVMLSEVAIAAVFIAAAVAGFKRNPWIAVARPGRARRDGRLPPPPRAQHRRAAGLAGVLHDLRRDCGGVRRVGHAGSRPRRARTSRASSPS